LDFKFFGQVMSFGGSFHDPILHTAKSIRRVDCDESAFGGASEGISGVRLAVETTSEQYFQKTAQTFARRQSENKDFSDLLSCRENLHLIPSASCRFLSHFAELRPKTDDAGKPRVFITSRLKNKLKIKL